MAQSRFGYVSMEEEKKTWLTFTETKMNCFDYHSALGNNFVPLKDEFMD